MNLGLTPLLAAIAAAPGDRFVLATVIETDGPTYRKPGAMMLLHADGTADGLISGGCLEHDLAQRAAGLWRSGERSIVTYDLREDDDSLWGLGLGCQGMIRLHLEVAEADNRFAGLADIEPHWQRGRRCWLVKQMPSDLALASVAQVAAEPSALPSAALAADSRAGAMNLTLSDGHRLVVPITPPRRLIICGGGPDVPPLVALASELDWRVTVYDHRPAYARVEHFPTAERVLCDRPEKLLDHVGQCDAAVIMSHHLPSDLEYVRCLASTAIGYVGLLGPLARRDELLRRAEVADPSCFYGPAGLDIGSDLPATIALSILAEAHAVLNRGEGGSLRQRTMRSMASGSN